MSVYKIASSISSIGILLIFTAIIIAQSSFSGYQCEGYDFTMHFISELGNPNKSEFHFLLNSGFMIVSLLFIPMTLLLGKYTESKLGKIAGHVGIVAMLAIFAVGCLPETIYVPHLIAAGAFFTISTIMACMFAYLSLKNHKMSKWLFIPSIIPVLLYISFLCYPKTVLVNISADPYNYQRPSIVWLAVLEWSYFLAMSLWVLCASRFLWKASK